LKVSSFLQTHEVINCQSDFRVKVPDINSACESERVLCAIK